MHLAHFGTFDVKNYGDLLFPRIAEHQLGGSFAQITHISPIGGSPYRDVTPSVSMSEVLEQGMQFDGVMIGGGNILHARPSGLPEYASVRRIAYPTLWAGAAELANSQGIPLVMNAPGVPRRLRRPTAMATRSALGRVAYAAVRDQLSADYLSAATISARIVPDSALQISDVFGPASALIDAFEGGESDEPGSYAVVHINDRYADGSPDAMAAILDELTLALGLPLHLLAIGPCHDDDSYAREVAALMSRSPRVWDELDRVQDLATVLANARLYIGSSLHGFITASSYRVPALLVTDMHAQHKFRGLLEQIALPDATFESWGRLLRHVRISRGLDSIASVPNLAEAHSTLDAHWSAINGALLSDRDRTPGRAYAGRWAPAVAATNFLDEGLAAAVKRRLLS
jgi:polysaccharide pyruvyl transferase WcaK-like protein